ncbi:hypothetical protein [Paraburkholderia tropica]|uniref:hypothetical protein n=1 Tax=Paraburkholderia tropica TaxID=92647 RepID=UPI00161B5ABD|nr:hypothetical protein [Paraburkholderia tropica]MBB6320578.1 hypothetical protein [Paraburkholderia tropica]
MNPFRIQIQCHGDDQGEKWCVQIYRDDVLVAAAHELADPSAARQAGEFLLFGALNQWSENTPTPDDISAGVDALNRHVIDLFGYDEPRNVELDAHAIDCARVSAIVHDVWAACVRRVRAAAALPG